MNKVNIDGNILRIKEWSESDDIEIEYEEHCAREIMKYIKQEKQESYEEGVREMWKAIHQSGSEVYGIFQLNGGYKELNGLESSVSKLKDNK